MPGETFLSSLTRSLWGRVAVLAISGLLGLAGVVAISLVVSNRQHATDPKPNDENAKADATGLLPADANPKPTLPLAQFNRRWLPEQTLLLVDLRLSRLAKQPPAMNSLAFLGPWWQPSSQALLLGLNLGQEQVRRLTWASTDLADCASHCVVILELEEGIDAGRLLPAGESIDLGANLVARRPQGGPWPHPLVAVDAHTIVTGNEEALRHLVARGGDAELASGPMELLLKKLSPGGDLAVMVDLLPVRTAAWKLPANLLDVWPAGKSKWHVLCETPLALGLSVQSADQRRCELGLVCNGETMAEKIRLDVEEAGARRDPGLARTHRRAEEHSPAAEVFGRGGRSIQAAPGRLAGGLAHGPLRYGGRHRLGAVRLGRAGAPGLGGHGHREFGRQCRPIGWPLPGPSMKPIIAVCSADCWAT